MKKVNVLALFLSILIAELTGLFSALLSGNIRSGYENFVKPPLSPPAILFPIVWTILYAAMGIAAYLVWDSVRGTSAERIEALKFYAAQLIVNFMWSIFFFRFEAYWLSVAIIVLLDILVIATTLKFKNINRLSYWLMLPYIAWLLFATYLNIGVAVLN
ncbi:MAG: tryptophan-rich sensory protein [Clostridia bacterium]|nr:tryptophan-rich sensory protein [Clostridia bacterium]